MYTLFAAAIPGLEPLVRQELIDLGFRLPEETPPSPEDAPAAAAPQPAQEREEDGGIEWQGSLSDMYRANLHLRTASRVLARIGEFTALNFAEFRKKASKLPWEQYLRPGQPAALRVTCRKSRLYHSDAVAERLAGAISDRLGQETPSVKFVESAEDHPQLVVVRLVHDQCTISIDTSGERLHRRGYRLATAKAPLRETLAAGLLLGAGWDSSAPLLDPFCGSGTITIEAARLARRIAPGKNRRFAFMDWPNYDPRLWQTLRDKAAAQEQPACAAIQASDRDAGAIELARANAERAGVLTNIEFTCRAVSAIAPPPPPGWIITNPPYGLRVSSGHDLRNLYARLGDILRAQCPGWQAGILCSDQSLVGQTRLSLPRSLRTVNGGVPVRFYMGTVTPAQKR
jgi:putative N6-adenine-specific DNA methylase